MSGQLSYPIAPPQWLEGQVTTLSGGGVRSFVNPLLAQISTLTAGGTATAGVYSVALAQAADPSFVPLTFSFTRVAETNAQIATALHALIVASTAMLGIATSVDGGAGVLTLTFKNTNIVWTLTTAAPALGTLVAANTQAAGGSNVRVGAFARSAATSNGNIIPFTTAATTAELAGITERTMNLVHNPALAYDVYPPGQNVAVLRNGTIACRTWEAVVKNDAVSVWIDPADATAFPGQVGKTVTASKSIAAPTGTRFLASAAAGAIVEVEITFGAGG